MSDKRVGKSFQGKFAFCAGLLMIALLVGCATQPELVTPTESPSTVVPSATNAPSATAEPSPTPTVGPSPRPTITPTPTPAVFSAAPVELPSIYTGTLPNGAIARLGNGFITSRKLSPDGKLLAIGTSTGLTMYDAISLEILWVDTTTRATSRFAWSADSTMITGTFQDSPVVITWDALSGERLYTLAGHSDIISDLEWSPVDNMLASASPDGTIILWDGETGTRLRTLPYTDMGQFKPDFDAEIHRVDWVGFEFSPDGTMIAARYQEPEGSDQLVARVTVVWDVQTGQIKHVLEDSGYQMIWSPDSTLLATHSKVWNVATGQVVGDLENDYTEEGCPRTAWATGNWSPESDLVGVIRYQRDTEEHYLQMCSGDGELLYTLSGVESFGGWSPDGQKFMALSPWLTIYSASGEMLYELKGVSIYGFYSLPDWTRFYYLTGESWYAHKTIEIWDISDEPSKTILASDSSPLMLLAWSSDGERLATIPSPEISDRENRMTVWDMETLKPAKVFTGSFFTWAPDLLTAAGWTDGYITIQDAFTDEVIQVHIGEEVRGLSLTWSPDGDLLAASGEEGLYFWDPKNGDLLQHRPLGNSYLGGTYIISWLPNSHKLAYENGDQFYLWDVLTDEEVNSLPIGHRIGYKSSYAGVVANDEYFTWSPDGDLMAFIEKESTNVLIYSTDSLELVQKFEVEGDQAVDLAFSPDGTRIAAITNREALSTLRTWDIETGRLLWEWHHSESPVSWRDGLTSIDWSPDGNRIAAGFGPLPVGYAISNRDYSSYGSEPGQVILLDTETGHLLGTFEGHTGGVEDVAFSPDGAVLAFASLDGTVILWDMSQH